MRILSSQSNDVVFYFDYFQGRCFAGAGISPLSWITGYDLGILYYFTVSSSKCVECERVEDIYHEMAECALVETERNELFMRFPGLEYDNVSVTSDDAKTLF